MASAALILLLLIAVRQLPYSRSLSLQSSSPLENQEKDNIGQLEQWISLNVKHYRKRAASLKWMQESVRKRKQVQVPASSLDPKLRNAEMNKMIISVSQDGSGNFKTIKEALASIPVYNKRRVILDIKPGVYREKINIPRSLSFVTFLGDSSDPPRITGNDTAAAAGTDGRPLKTFQSATVSVDADYFVAVNVIFENTAPHVVGSVGEQAVALRISGNKAAFYDCSFYGSQDTLYDHKGLHYFNNCFIQGSVDFIFGYGRSLYENCHLNSVAKKVASLTAQKRTNSSILSGFSFKNSTITGTGSVYLGRAWGDYSRVIFSYTYMDKIVLPLGWSDWGKTSRDSRVYYGEYRCSGPGANMTGRVPWARILTDEEAMPFIGTYYIDGNSWLIHP
ncbi:PREDICTED: probable pectinesterase 53 [Nicotiana attenuata]|uniref:Pectinesterase n=1 Tax=Nicotiana attenuata TaxID=49451 RepID=A0A1J6JBF4_NICAT|nr:PREDICTED: probable pectinesterase 53 [Nicotiana attenuata]OIT08163.1 putative pectinesterase 53 [Nicotiana attenuata]